MKKKITLLVFSCLISFSFFAESFTLENFKKEKIGFYCSENNYDVVTRIDELLANLFNNQTEYSEDTYLTIENNLILEKINFLSDNEKSNETKYLLLNNQSLKNELFVKDKNQRSFSSDYLVSLADIKTRLLSYLSSSKMYSESAAAKNLYLKALKKNGKSCVALTSYATWLYFAPPIAGGGYSEALKIYSKAEKYAQSNEELFFAIVYKSQALFSLNKKNEAIKELEKAHNLFPSENFTKVIGEKNEKGLSFFD